MKEPSTSVRADLGHDDGELEPRKMINRPRFDAVRANAEKAFRTISGLMLAAGLLGASVGTTAAPVVSVSANAAANAPNFLAGLQLVQRMGARGQFISNTWHDLEPRKGSYKLDDLAGGLHYIGDTLGDTLLLGVQVLNTTVKDVPDDLKAIAFDDPKMQARASALLDRIASLPGARRVR
ncbi:MAG: hypothetical protein NVS1B14_05530 [Vulcanimicrobiaceae bacterium]